MLFNPGNEYVLIDIRADYHEIVCTGLEHTPHSTQSLVVQISYSKTDQIVPVILAALQRRQDIRLYRDFATNDRFSCISVIDAFEFGDNVFTTALATLYNNLEPLSA